MEMRTERPVLCSEESPRAPGTNGSIGQGRGNEEASAGQGHPFFTFPRANWPFHSVWSGPPRSCFWVLELLVVGTGANGWEKFPSRAARKKVWQVERGVWRPAQLPAPMVSGGGAEDGAGEDPQHWWVWPPPKPRSVCSSAVWPPKLSPSCYSNSLGLEHKHPVTLHLPRKTLISFSPFSSLQSGLWLFFTIISRFKSLGSTWCSTDTVLFYIFQVLLKNMKQPKTKDQNNFLEPSGWSWIA